MSFVQSINAASSSSVSALSTSGITTFSGDILIAVLAAFSTTVTATITDTYGNTWLPHPLSPLKTATTGVGIYAWYAKNVVGGAGHSFTYTVSAAGQVSAIVHEYSGRALDFPMTDSEGIADASPVTAHNVGTLTTPQSGCDLFACMSNNTASSNESITPGTGWTIPANSSNLVGTSFRVSMAMYQQNVIQGQYQGTFTTGDSVQCTGLMFAIKQPSYTFIQQSSTSSAASVSTLMVPATGTITFTTGNTLIYAIKYAASSIQSITINDTLNNTWQQISNYFDAATGVGLSFGFASNIVGGQDNVNLVLGTAQTMVGLYVAEVAGLATSPFTQGEFVINKVVSPGNGANGIASSFTSSIAKRPALLFGFCFDLTNTAGQTLTPGSNFNALSPVWAMGSGQFTSLPEHKRI